MITRFFIFTLLWYISTSVLLWDLPPLENRIVGGRSVSINKAPFLVSLQLFGSHMCGGSLITVKHIVTAAHCTDRIPVSVLTIRAGSTLLETGGQVLPVAKLHQNPKYSIDHLSYDISILELKGSVKLSENVSPIRLASPRQKFPDGTKASVFGWGSLSSGSAQPVDNLHTVEVEVVSLKICRKVYAPHRISDVMLCAGVPQGGKDACQGDSGGPLVIRNMLVGIISFGYGCGEPFTPGVYSFIPALRSYIDKFVTQ